MSTEADLASAARRPIDWRPVEIRPGLWSIPVAIPIASLQAVNVYVLELAGGGIALVDAGWDSEESWRSLRDGLTFLGRRLDEVRKVVVTHAHPDHLGLAYRVAGASGAGVLVHELEAGRLRGGRSGPLNFRRALEATYPRWGVPSARVEEMLAAGAPSSEESWTAPVTGVPDGAMLDLPGWSVRAVWTPGHTQGHLCLYDTGHRLLFSGDHVLPRITPGVGVHPAEESDVLGDFLASLRKVAALDVEEVLPGHENRFSGLRERTDFLAGHHDLRLDEVESVVRADPGVSGWQVTRRIGWSRPLERFGSAMVRAAVAETMSHLVHLETLGRLARLDRNGVSTESWVPRDS
ncbi:MBL fold metallo-hydrolase [Streptosporangium sp. NPDC005286]|uniref:MBL fold metallo-hydrolase n=1 Tax=Streptosporangium sp. NPDC005286 TaxID=3154463 RepID=UPI0033A11887